MQGGGVSCQAETTHTTVYLTFFPLRNFLTNKTAPISPAYLLALDIYA